MTTAIHVIVPHLDASAAGNLLLGGTGALLAGGAAGAHNGDANTGVGFGQFGAATTAYACTAFGYAALNKLTTGHSETALGYQAGHSLTTGVMNTLIGVDAALIATTMNYTVVVGHHVLNLGVFTGEGGVFIGQQTARNLTSGNNLVVIGRNAMANCPATGSDSSIVAGSNSLIKSSVSQSVVLGVDILQSSSGSATRSATDSVIIGHRALFGAQTAATTVALGAFAFFQADGDAMSSTANVAVGDSVGYLVDADSCVFLGSRAGAHATKTALVGVVVIGPRAGDVGGGATALADNDFVIANSYTDARRLLWGNFADKVLNLRGDALSAVDLPTYADNAAAVTAGLAVDRLYATATGEVRIVV